MRDLESILDKYSRPVELAKQTPEPQPAEVAFVHYCAECGQGRGIWHGTERLCSDCLWYAMKHGRTLFRKALPRAEAKARLDAVLTRCAAMGLARDYNMGKPAWYGEACREGCCQQ